VAERQVNMIVRRGNRVMERLPAVVDTRDVDAMQAQLEGWLSANRWNKRHWPDFEAEFRGEGKPVTVRVVA
jgi:hypothetical protein